MASRPTPNRPILSGWPPEFARLLAATLAIVQTYAGLAEARMKGKAPWIDRSSLARGGLTAGTMMAKVGTANMIFLYMQHTMDYGKWLETVNGALMGARAHVTPDELTWKEHAGPLAIIHPTADYVGPRLQTSVLGVWNRTAA